MALPGRTWHVGTVIWYLAGLQKRHVVRLEYGKARDAGLDRHVVRRGLARLEEAGLVEVDRSRGRCPVVTILEARLEP
jgi:hypothetical protein